jgi:thiol-disulfide isomerase/thioredoxin
MFMRAIAITVLACSAAAHAQSLRVGDPAPRLSIDEWMRGQPVSSLSDGRVYLVEFWATWCGPCMSQIPHLARLQQQHERRGLVVIGVAAMEQGGRDDLVRWLASSGYGRQMQYTVAYNPAGSMVRDWMQPAGLSGIPAAFVVNRQGRIAWLGHPNSSMDRAIEAALNEPVPAAAEPAARTERGLELTVGDPAPALSVETWLHGDPIESLSRERVHVVGFWTPSDAASMRDLPRLNALQEQDERVRVIGVVVKDSMQDVERAFRARREGGGGEMVRFAVALDRREGGMEQGWLRAAGVRDVPIVFIVDDRGRIAWIGPAEEAREPLARILDGSWDILAAAERWSEQKRRLAESRGASERAMEAVLEPALRGQTDAAVRALQALFRRDADAGLRVSRDVFTTLMARDRFAEAYDFARSLPRTDAARNAQLLNDIAWAIVSPDAPPTVQDTDAALQLARRALQLTRSQDPRVLATMARASFLRDDLATAVRVQRRAVELSEGEEAQRMRDLLEEYETAASQRRR